MAKKIIIIDDDPTQRLIAARDLRQVMHRLILPESVSSLLTTGTDQIGLCITDRWLGETWHAATDEFIGRLDLQIPVWEWTCDEWNNPIWTRVQRVIYKRPGALLAAINEWLGITQ